MVYGVIPLEHFRELFSAVCVWKQGVISLRDGDLGIVARYPDRHGTAGTVGKKGLSQEFQKLLAARRNSGTFTARPPVDNVERTYTFRKSSRYPLFINVGLATDDYLEEWWGEVDKISAAVELFLLFTLIALRRISRDWKLRNDEVLALVSREAKFRTFSDYTHGWEFWLDADGSFIHTSPSCKRITGHNAEVFYADPGLLTRIIHPEDPDAFTRFQREVISGTDADTLVFRICRGSSWNNRKSIPPQASEYPSTPLTSTLPRPC